MVQDHEALLQSLGCAGLPDCICARVGPSPCAWQLQEVAGSSQATQNETTVGPDYTQTVKATAEPERGPSSAELSALGECRGLETAPAIHAAIAAQHVSQLVTLLAQSSRESARELSASNCCLEPLLRCYVRAARAVARPAPAAPSLIRLRARQLALVKSTAECTNSLLLLRAQKLSSEPQPPLFAELGGGGFGGEFLAAAAALHGRNGTVPGDVQAANCQMLATILYSHQEVRNFFLHWRSWCAQTY